MHDLSQLTAAERFLKSCDSIKNPYIKSLHCLSPLALIPWIKSTAQTFEYYIIINCSCITLEICFKIMQKEERGLKWEVSFDLWNENGFRLKLMFALELIFSIEHHHSQIMRTNKYFARWQGMKNVLKCIWMTMGKPANSENFGCSVIYLFAFQKIISNQYANNKHEFLAWNTDKCIN